MRPATVGGIILIVLGAVALVVRSVTYFTTEQVTGPFGFLTWNEERPYTIFISPLAGIAAVVIGLVLVFMARRSTAV